MGLLHFIKSKTIPSNVDFLSVIFELITFYVSKTTITTDQIEICLFDLLGSGIVSLKALVMQSLYLLVSKDPAKLGLPQYQQLVEQSAHPQSYQGDQLALGKINLLLFGLFLR